ncbi:MAG: response regulator [Anaerolineae bacterium]|nr:response regulator [Anaerolineae bacterium]
MTIAAIPYAAASRILRFSGTQIRLRRQRPGFLLPGAAGACSRQSVSALDEDEQETTAAAPPVTDDSTGMGATMDAMKRSARVLIVEDESVVALDLRLTLRRMGYDVIGIASSGEEAVNAAQQAQPDLILMDIRLRGRIDGIQAATLIRSRHDTPIIFLTAQSDETTRKRAESVSSFKIIMKPFSPVDLESSISTALDTKKVDRDVDQIVRT